MAGVPEVASHYSLSCKWLASGYAFSDLPERVSAGQGDYSTCCRLFSALASDAEIGHFRAFRRTRSQRLFSFGVSAGGGLESTYPAIILPAADYEDVVTPDYEVTTRFQGGSRGAENSCSRRSEGMLTTCGEGVFIIEWE